MFFASTSGGARAALVATDEMVEAGRRPAPQEPNARERVLRALQRDDVAAALVLRGIDVVQARQRVAALTDSEVRDLDAGLDSAPAGSYWLTPFFVASLVVAVMYLINRMDLFDRWSEATRGRPQSVD